jgi:pyruvate dehydrogenase E2 component (dihydrolipoamide acetyltransferase)
MAKDVIMPVLGMNQDTALLVEWLAAEGDTVVEGEPIMEVETDKAVMQLDAPASGVLVDVSASAGEDVTVGSVIARIVADGEAPPPQRSEAVASDASAPAPSAAAPPEPATAVAPDGTPAAASATAPVPTRERSGPRTPASPLARRTAEERGLDLDALPGSGPHGAVLMRDLPDAADEASRAPAEAAAPETAPAPAVTTVAPQSELERRLQAGRLLEMLASAEAPLPAAIARFLAAVVARRLPDDLTAGVTLEVRGPEGTAAIAHAERRSILAFTELMASGGAEPGDAGAPTAVLVHAGEAPLDAVRPNAAAPVALGLARPDGGDTLVLTLRYRADRVDDALALTMLADLARLVDDPSVLAVAF